MNFGKIINNINYDLSVSFVSNKFLSKPEVFYE